MPKFTLNEKELEAKPGQTIIQAAADHGFEIPHYCYHEDLPIDGNCRMCLVEVEKMPKLTPACTTVVSEGMVVRSNNERVRQAVRGVLEFLLINHPVDCPVCDQAGECRLQDYYMVYGLHTSEIPLEMKVRKGKAIPLGEMVMLDQERCVLCSRCIRFFDHVTGTGEMQFFNRGDHVEIGTFEGRPLENPYSGNVVDICPVGALTSRDFRFKCRVWFLNSTDSVCTGCSTGCTVRIDHRDGTIFRMLPRRNPEVNSSWLCDEGRLSYHNIQAAERALRPNAKGGDGIQAPVSWDEAALSIAATLRQYAPESIIAFGSGSATNETLYLMKRYLTAFGVTQFEFRLDREDRTATEREDQILRHRDKRPNSTGAINLGYVTAAPGSIDSAIAAAEGGRLKAGVILFFRPLVHRDEHEILEHKLARLVAALDYSVVLASHKVDWLTNASVVLPVAAWSEEEGTYTNYQGRVQMGLRAVDPPGDALPAWEAFASLIHAAGMPSPWMSPSDVFADLTSEVDAFKDIRYEQTQLPGALLKSLQGNR